MVRLRYGDLCTSSLLFNSVLLLLLQYQVRCFQLAAIRRDAPTSGSQSGFAYVGGCR